LRGEPLCRYLLSCDALVFLVDVADVLGSGVQKLNDMQETIRKLLECVDRSREFLRRIVRVAVNALRWMTFYAPLIDKWGSIDRIAFVASKADKVHPCDRDKLKLLITALAEPLTRNQGPKREEYWFFSM